jgi:ABC-type multidrug transport system fused ATPase/permease subunit
VNGKPLDKYLHKTKEEKDTVRNKQIVSQVERWDLFARLFPTVFLIITVILIVAGIIDFDTAFFVGLGLFAVTAVTWWFWAIYTIKHLVYTLNTASKGLKEVKDEFVEINKSIQEMRNDES